MSVDEQTCLESPSPPQRVRLSSEEVGNEQLYKQWVEQEKYIDYLEERCNTLQDADERLKQHMQDSARRENVLVMRLTTKEHDIQELISQTTELKAAQIPGMNALRSHLLDPAVNLMLDRLKKELATTKAKLEDTQNELSAWKFTPDSNTGKRLMAKCKMLFQENEELGTIVSSGRIAKLEGDLALQKNLCETLKKSQTDSDEVLQAYDEDMEGMQSTIYYLQQQLREAKEQIGKLQSVHRTPTQQLNGDIDMEDDRTKEVIASDRESPTSDAWRTQYQRVNDIVPNGGQQDCWPAVNSVDCRTKEEEPDKRQADETHEERTSSNDQQTNDTNCIFQNNVEHDSNPKTGEVAADNERTPERNNQSAAAEDDSGAAVAGGEETPTGRGRRKGRRREVRKRDAQSPSVPPSKRTRSSMAVNQEPEPEENGLPEEGATNSY